MSSSHFTSILLGKDRRSLGRSKEVIDLVEDQQSFDELFGLLLHHERLLVIRAADAIEKITLLRKEFLEPHKLQLLSLLKSALDKELKWHIALLVPRIKLNDDELKNVWGVLMYWVQNPNESKIVRVNSLQGLFELSKEYPGLKLDLERTLGILEHIAIPSIQARIKKIGRLRFNEKHKEPISTIDKTLS
jgi:hypothetical protein